MLLREDDIDDDKRLELIKLSAEDFESFKKQFEILSPTEKIVFKQYLEQIQKFLQNNENSKIEDVTGFPPPS